MLITVLTNPRLKMFNMRLGHSNFSEKLVSSGEPDCYITSS